MTAEQAVFFAILACIAGAFVTLLVARSKTFAGWVSFLFVTVSAGLVLDGCAKVLLQGPSGVPGTFLAAPKFGFVVRIHVDGLSAMFLLLAVLIAVPAALYSISYMRHYREYGVGRYYPHFLLFLAAMYGLLSTTDMMWFFLMFWQLMTLPGYALIRFEHRKHENVRAATNYLIMMQLACTLTLIGAQLLVTAGSPAGASLPYDFDTVRASMPMLLARHPVLMAFAFACFLVGFGIKMGMWPFGRAWLPDAHPAAPSPVSAMLSGVMIKTGVYGLIRYFLWLVPTRDSHFPMAYWGMIVAVLGTITLFTGTMQALQQEQSKRLLAFHSIGQVGYILLGVGACLALLPTGPAMAPLAALGLFGALLHVINHGVFKGLLFLNAGSMLHATDTQDLNRLGGLMKFMPLTAITALIASLSISGVPLFNGFVSKWTIYVAAIGGSATAHYLVVCAVVAILTSALTLASFIKFFGSSFLSRTSSLVTKCAAEHRLEPGLLMQIPQLFLAALCVLLGVVPAIGFQLLLLAFGRNDLQSVQAMAGAAVAASISPLRGIEMSDGQFVPLALALILGFMFVTAFTISRLGRARRRTAVPWLCGYARETDSNRYVAHNFYSEIKRYFRWLDGAKHAPGRQP